MCAASNGHKDVVECLLDRGADTETRYWEGDGDSTALTLAAHMRRTEVVECLLDRGANIEARQGINDRTVLIWAAWKGHGDVVDVLLDRGADIEARDSHGYTSLLGAAQAGHREVVECLLEGYPDVGQVSPKRECSTLLAAGHLLESKQNDAMGASSQDLLVMNEVDQYLRRGQRADINARTNAGDTAVALAARHGHSNVVECLRARGAVA